MDYDEIIRRVGYFRTRANLSQRETSLRLGYNPQFMQTIENKQVQLKVSTLLDFCDVVGITFSDFVYLGKTFNPERKEILDVYSSLSEEKQDTILKLMKSMK